MKRTLALCAIAAGCLFSTQSASGVTIGYCLIGGANCDGGATLNTAAAAAITASGNTPQALTGLAAGNLSGIGVLWLMNGNINAYDALYTTNLAGITSYVNAGGVLSFHDRAVYGASGTTPTVLPGGAAITFTPSVAPPGNGSTVDIETGGTLVTNGPGGVVTNTTLDGGGRSNHGWASLATLPAGAVAILNNGTAGQIVDFSYALGLGVVYYSSIPIDYYLAGSGSDPFRSNALSIYLPNELAYQASLAEESGIPEPATLTLIGGGLLGVLLLKRRSALRS